MVEAGLFIDGDGPGVSRGKRVERPRKPGLHGQATSTIPENANLSAASAAQVP